MLFQSKLPNPETNIFTIMSSMAKEYDAINLGQGFPDFDCDERLKALVSKYLQEGKNQYSPMPGLPELRQTLSEKIRKTYHRDVSSETQICITAGATQAIFTAIQAFIQDGDEVIIMEPAYDCYQPAIRIAGGLPRIYRMTSPDYTIDWDRIHDMVTDQTKMIIINTPHNPTGTLLVEKDLQSLEQIVSGKDIIVLSDEVYEHLIYDEEEHQSVIRFPHLFEQSLAVFSFGKTLHATGWKLGYIVGPENLITEFKNIHQWNVFSVHSFTQYAISDYLKQPESYLQLPEFFEKKRDYLTELLADTPLIPYPSKGTYFQRYSYAEISTQNDVDFAKFLTKEIGVATIPMSPFYTKTLDDHVIRLCFAKKNETLEKAAQKLRKLSQMAVK
ncbi:MAG: methionine aminotransferase [Bacteroidota bacterium]